VLKEREYQLQHREREISAKERALRDLDWYNRQLRVREWEDINARDQELSYLLWRQQQLSKYFWKDNGMLCRYVTTYRKGVRTNQKVTICRKKGSITTCYHPKRYYIYPVTKLMCYRPNDRRVLGAIIRPYPY
jgi:hypothetical protein